MKDVKNNFCDFKKYSKQFYELYEEFDHCVKTMIVQTDNHIMEVPARQKGNTVYNRIYQEKFRKAKDLFDKKSKITNHSSNILFLTLTYKVADSADENEVRLSWKEVPHRLSTNNYFFRKLKKLLGVRSFVLVFEAHQSGVCHVHIGLLCSSNFELDYTNNRKLKNADSLIKEIEKSWGLGSIKISGCNNTEYLFNYLGKNFGYGIGYKEISSKSCEEIVNRCVRADKNGKEVVLTDDELKLVLSYYYSKKEKVRMIRSSTDIGGNVRRDTVSSIKQIIADDELVQDIDYENESASRFLENIISNNSDIPYTEKERTYFMLYSNGDSSVQNMLKELHREKVVRIDSELGKQIMAFINSYPNIKKTVKRAKAK